MSPVLLELHLLYEVDSYPLYIHQWPYSLFSSHLLASKVLNNGTPLRNSHMPLQSCLQSRCLFGERPAQTKLIWVISTHIIKALILQWSDHHLLLKMRNNNILFDKTKIGWTWAVHSIAGIIQNISSLKLLPDIIIWQCLKGKFELSWMQKFERRTWQLSKHHKIPMRDQRQFGGCTLQVLLRNMVSSRWSDIIFWRLIVMCEEHIAQGLRELKI